MVILQEFGGNGLLSYNFNLQFVPGPRKVLGCRENLPAYKLHEGNMVASF